MKTVAVNENIRLHFIPMTKLKTTSVGVYIHRPLSREKASYNALLPMVLKRGSADYKTREEISAKLDDLYGATMGSTVMKMGVDQIIYFDAETIADKYAPNGEKLLSELLELLMSVLFKPNVSGNAFDGEVLEQEKKNAIDRIDAFVNDKRQYASSRCQNETARGTNFAISRFGEKEIIEKITAEELYNHYKAIITSSVIDFYICGDVDEAEAESVLRSFTKDMEFSAAEITREDIITRDSDEINRVTEEMDVKQGKLAMCFLTGVRPGSKDSFALAVFNSIFGAGAHSKLFNNVREKLSLAYYASSQIKKMKGIIVVNAGIEFENFQKAYDEILVQLEDIQKGNISEFEFNSSVITIINTYKGYYDDQRALTSFNLSQKIADTNMSIDDYIEGIKNVTVDDVVRVAKKLKLDTVYFLKGKEDVQCN